MVFKFVLYIAVSSPSTVPTTYMYEFIESVTTPVALIYTSSIDDT